MKAITKCNQLKPIWTFYLDPFWSNFRIENFVPLGRICDAISCPRDLICNVQDRLCSKVPEISFWAASKESFLVNFQDEKNRLLYWSTDMIMWYIKWKLFRNALLWVQYELSTLILSVRIFGFKKKVNPLERQFVAILNPSELFYVANQWHYCKVPARAFWDGSK